MRSAHPSAHTDVVTDWPFFDIGKIFSDGTFMNGVRTWESRFALRRFEV